MTRPLLEQVIRRRVSSLDNVRIEDGVAVDRVEVSDGRVAGVVVDGEVRPADLVVDSSGRSSRIAHQLESSGVLAPPVTRVLIDCAYASGFLPRSADDFEGSFLVCGTSPPTSFRGGAVLPVEGDRWMVTLAGVHDDVPGTTEDEVLEFARSLLSPAVAQLVEHAGPLSTVASYRFPSSQRRHYERYDGCCRGSSRSVTRRAASTPSTVRACRAPLCRPTRSARRCATWGCVRRSCPAVPPAGGEDHRRSLGDRGRRRLPAPADGGPKARGTDQVNRYVLRVVRATHTSVELAKSFNLVLNLVEPTRSLARPSVVARVLASGIPGRRQTRMDHPRVGPPAG